VIQPTVGAKHAAIRWGAAVSSRRFPLVLSTEYSPDSGAIPLTDSISASGKTPYGWFVAGAGRIAAGLGAS